MWTLYTSTLDKETMEKITKRSTYRHGDLHRTLLEAAIELARKGGKDAIVLREVTRQAGVAPNAAYRHFEDISPSRNPNRDYSGWRFPNMPT